MFKPKTLSKIMRIFVFFCLTFFLINISCEDNSNIEVVNKSEYKNLIKKNFPIIDVRTPAEFWEGHIDNAINIDFKSNSFINEISKLDKSKTYLIYCRSGNRSSKAATIMDSLGFKKTIDLEGGFLRW